MGLLELSGALPIFIPLNRRGHYKRTFLSVFSRSVALAISETCIIQLWSSACWLAFIHEMA